jgi:putative CocE/NonD family hydrolase
VGWTQWSAAAQGSRFLTCMAPVVPFSNAYREIAYPGGAFQLSLAMGWGAGVGGLPLDPAKLKEAFNLLPLKNWDELAGKPVFFLHDWVAHPTYDDYWRVRGIDGRFDRVTVPALNIGGWYDIFSKATLDHIAQVRHRSTNLAVRRNQFVVLGPWGHGVGGQKLGELDFGANARLDLGKLQFEWFEYWLKGKDTGVQDWPSVRLFVMGENAWRNEHEWPLARTQFTPWYLHGSGKANTSAGDGSLSPAAPAAEPADHFTYDSAHPVPTHGGNNLVALPPGPFDQAAVEQRADVLVYTSAALKKAVEVTGPVRVFLHAASSARDTDFTAKLVDVHPDGKAYNLCDGIIRARCRESVTAPTLLEPGKPYRYEIDLWVTSNLFQPGHRLRVEIASSNFPRFDRNPNTGHDFGADAELAQASQTIRHDREHPSHILLPIIPR